MTWQSKKQNVVARSSVEVKFHEMASGICELLWLQKIMMELRLPFETPMKLYCDNKATINIANNPMQHYRTKHIEIGSHFIKEKRERGDICMSFIPTSQQVVDILTKGLFKPNFDALVNKLGLHDILIFTSQLEEEY